MRVFSSPGDQPLVMRFLRYTTAGRGSCQYRLHGWDGQGKGDHVAIKWRSWLVFGVWCLLILGLGLGMGLGLVVVVVTMVVVAMMMAYSTGARRPLAQLPAHSAAHPRNQQSPQPGAKGKRDRVSQPNSVHYNMILRPKGNKANAPASGPTRPAGGHQHSSRAWLGCECAGPRRPWLTFVLPDLGFSCRRPKVRAVDHVRVCPEGRKEKGKKKKTYMSGRGQDETRYYWYKRLGDGADAFSVLRLLVQGRTDRAGGTKLYERTSSRYSDCINNIARLPPPAEVWVPRVRAEQFSTVYSYSLLPSANLTFSHAFLVFLDFLLFFFLSCFVRFSLFSLFSLFSSLFSLPCCSCPFRECENFLLVDAGRSGLVLSLHLPFFLLTARSLAC